MGHRLLIALGVESDEGRPLLRMLSVAAIMGIGRMLLYAAGYGMFLERFDATRLPWAYLLVVLLSAAAVAVYIRLSKMLPLQVLLPGTFAVLSGFTVIARFALMLPYRDVIVFTLPIWYEVVAVVTHLVYWALAGRLFNVQQGKRLFGLLNSGDRLADLTGLFTPLLVAAIGAPNLFAAGGFALGLAVIPLASASAMAPRIAKSATNVIHDTREASAARGFTLRNRYIRSLAIQLMLATFAFHAIDIVFFGRVGRHLSNAGEIAGFLGVFFAVIGGVCVIGQALLASRAFRWIGVRGVLLIVPASLLMVLSSVAISWLLIPTEARLFIGIAIARFCASVLVATFNEPAISLLYQPFPASQRLQVQGWNDGIVIPASIGLTGITALALQRAFQLEPISLVLGICAIAAIWLCVSISIGRQYSSMVRGALASGAPVESHAIQMPPEQQSRTPPYGHGSGGILSELADRARCLCRALLEVPSGDAFSPIRQALYEELAAVREQVFSVLCLIARPEHVSYAKQALHVGDTAQQALALESLENALSSSDWKLVFPILNPGFDHERRIKELSNALLAFGIRR